MVGIWHTSPVKSLADAMHHETILGATGKGSETYIDPTILNAALGTKFKMVMGYRSGGDLGIAMERGEIHGYAGPILNYLGKGKRHLDAGNIRLLAQMGLRKQPKFPNVPLVTEFVKDEQARRIVEFIAARAQVGRAFVAPPGVPADRVAALREAFARTMKDAAFLKEAGRLNMEIDPSDGEAVRKTVLSILATPKDVVARASAIIKR